MKSPNYSSRRGWKPDMIVMHITEGSFSGAVSWLSNKASGVSSHYVTGVNGELEQLVDLDKMSWANGTSSKKNSNVYYGSSSLELVRQRKTNANYYTISIENEGFSYKDYKRNIKGALTEKQYETVLQLCKELIEKYPAIKIDREHIVGHYQIAPIAKPKCPANFPFDRLIEDLKEWKKEFSPYKVKITASILNVRAGASTNYNIVTTVKKNEVYTIVDEDNGWGKLKSGAGYISLKYTKKI